MVRRLKEFLPKNINENIFQIKKGVMKITKITLFMLLTMVVNMI